MRSKVFKKCRTMCLEVNVLQIGAQTEIRKKITNRKCKVQAPAHQMRELTVLQFSEARSLANVAWRDASRAPQALRLCGENSVSSYWPGHLKQQAAEVLGALEDSIRIDGNWNSDGSRSWNVPINSSKITNSSDKYYEKQHYQNLLLMTKQLCFGSKCSAWESVAGKCPWNRFWCRCLLHTTIRPSKTGNLGGPCVAI